MELILAHQNATQISVTCDGQDSHTFDLSIIPPLKYAETHDYPTDPILYGQALYKVLFPIDTLASQSLAATPERIVLIAPDEDLDAIAWEYLHGPTGFLVQECHFVRSLPIEQRIQPPTLDTGLHIVAIPSNPLSSGVAPLNIDAEWQRLTEIVNALPFALTLERTRPPTIKQLRATVAGQHHRVVHFMGHGAQHNQGAILCFEKDNGDLDLVSAKDFALRVRGTTFLVTLNSCESAAPGDTAFSNLALVLVSQKIPYTLGMRFPIPDDDARLFSRVFYADLASGSSVEEALLQARLTLARESPRPWVVGIPVLYTSLSTPATGFVRKDGNPVILEHQPRIEVSALPRAEGTFQGRAEDLKRLGALLTGDNRPRILTIHGGGGQGKTALARETVERFAHAWPGGVWGTTLEDLPDRVRFAAGLARFLGINLQEIGDSQEIERQILARLTGQRMLIVLDNVETLVDAVEADNPVAIQLGQFLQQLPSVSVSLFVTARVPLAWVGETIYDELGGLTPKEGSLLFEQCAPEKTQEIDRGTAWEISEKVEGHPLSLRLLGSAFNASTITLSAFMKEYETQLMEAHNKYRDKDHRHRSLYACIDTSVRYLDTDLCNLLSNLWIFHAPFLARTAVAIFDPDGEDSEKSPSLVHDRLRTLRRRSLLTRQRITVPDGTLYFYHLLPTTRLYIEEHLHSSYSREEILSRFGTAYAGITRILYDELDRSASAVTIAQQAEGDLERAVSYLPDTEQASYKIYWAWILSRMSTPQRRPQRSLKLLEEALEQVQGNQVSLTALAFNNMALVNHAIGQSQRALSLYEQILSIIRKVGNRAEEAIVLNNMAEVYRTIGQWERAQNLYKQVLPIMHEVGNREGEAATLNNMAMVYQIIGQDKQALNLYEQVLSIVREMGNRMREAETLNNMADTYRVLEQWQEALSLHEQALPIRHEMGDRAGEAITLNNMALVYRAIGQWERALNWYEQAMSIRQEVGDRAGEAITLNNMAGVYQAIGQWEQALSLFEQALPIIREVGNPAEEAMLLNNIAILLSLHFKRIQDALRFMQQALDILKRTDLPQDAAGHTQEQIQQWLQAMRQGMPLTDI